MNNFWFSIPSIAYFICYLENNSEGKFLLKLEILCLFFNKCCQVKICKGSENWSFHTVYVFVTYKILDLATLHWKVNIELLAAPIEICLHSYFLENRWNSTQFRFSEEATKFDEISKLICCFFRENQIN